MKTATPNQYFTAERKLRVCRFKPYRDGPRFQLETFDTYERDSMGKNTIAYRFTMLDGNTRTVLFEGADFRCSPMDAIDSDAAVAALMGFLTLRPGDTDAEYFANYSDAQREFAETHAESLSIAVYDRFGGA
jgi:hypothetical protein